MLLVRMDNNIVDFVSDSEVENSSRSSHGSHHPSRDSDRVGPKVIFMSEDFGSKRMSGDPLEE